MATRKISMDEFVNFAIQEGIEEVANIVVMENDAELQKFIAIDKVGGPQAYLEALLESTEVEISE
jgi:hypothetical protein